MYLGLKNRDKIIPRQRTVVGKKHAIVALSTVNEFIAIGIAGIEAVIAIAAEIGVDTVSAFEGVVAGVAEELIVAFAADERVVAVAAVKLAAKIPGGNDIVAIATEGAVDT